MCREAAWIQVLPQVVLGGISAFYVDKSKVVSGSFYFSTECPWGLAGFPLRLGTRWKDALQVSIDNYSRLILDDIRAISWLTNNSDIKNGPLKLTHNLNDFDLSAQKNKTNVDHKMVALLAYLMLYN